MRKLLSMITAVRVHSLCPAIEAAGGRLQANGGSGARLTIGALQILKENAPGHAIHDQMMGREKQALAAIDYFNKNGANERPVGHMQTALGFCADRCDLSGRGRLARPQVSSPSMFRVMLVPRAASSP